MKIGLFDSGIGGTTILNAIQEILPDEEYKYIADSKNCPYGEKSDRELRQIVTKNVKTLQKWGAKIIVVACNTATTRCISYLRKKFPELQFVGTEPAIKLAVQSGAKNILVMATPGTIRSERLRYLLKKNQKSNQTIKLLACPGLADLIEKNYPSHNLEPITNYLTTLFEEIDQTPDAIVIGCTHYLLIKDQIRMFFSNSKLIDGNAGIVKRVQDLKNVL
ncbi:glutamate racemase [Candidatus Saccharibacteria bacterium]|nr:glutamate racemase [Candidatus Saccharibacteria bacterium]